MGLRLCVVVLFCLCIGSLAACVTAQQHTPTEISRKPATVTATVTELVTVHATSTKSSARPLAPGCHRGDPRAGVNTPLRLIVRSPCLVVEGIAGCIYMDKDDGDSHIALYLDPSYRKYLTEGNKSWTCASDQTDDDAPRMVIEVIPQHCTIRPDNCADRGHFTTPKLPRNGQHVTITGAWVQDTSHRFGRTLWSEIHPAFRIVVDG